MVTLTAHRPKGSDVKVLWLAASVASGVAEHHATWEQARDSVESRFSADEVRPDALAWHQDGDGYLFTHPVLGLLWTVRPVKQRSRHVR